MGVALRATPDCIFGKLDTTIFIVAIFHCHHAKYVQLGIHFFRQFLRSQTINEIAQCACLFIRFIIRTVRPIQDSNKSEFIFIRRFFTLKNLFEQIES